MSQVREVSGILWERFHRPTKFILIGGIGALIQLGLLAAFVAGFSLKEQFSQNIANFMAIFLAAEVVFPLHFIITWGDRKKSGTDVKRLLRQLFIYNSTRVGAWGIQVISFMLINLWASYLLAGVISNIITAIANYLVGDKLVFIPRKEEVVEVPTTE